MKWRLHRDFEFLGPMIAANPGTLILCRSFPRSSPWYVAVPQRPCGVVESAVVSGQRCTQARSPCVHRVLNSTTVMMAHVLLEQDLTHP